MAANDPVPNRPKRNAPLWVKIFVPLHIIAITSWAIPYAPSEYMGNPPRSRPEIRTGNPIQAVSSSAEYARNEFLIGNELYVKNSPLKLYLLATGFWQYWDMFAPNPANTDLYCDAMVYFRDGSARRYEYPRIFTLSLGQKFLKERWRKFFERAGSTGPKFAYLRPVFAQRIALMNYADPQNPPVRVELHRHQMVINAPGMPENHAYSDEMFFRWTVNQPQLRRDKGL
jgi:hypothetical protein